MAPLSVVVEAPLSALAVPEPAPPVIVPVLPEPPEAPPEEPDGLPEAPDDATMPVFGSADLANAWKAAKVFSALGFTANTIP